MASVVVQPGVELNAESQTFLANVVKAYGSSVVVTSGYRAPQKQAAAMYDKFKAGGSYLIYRQQDAAKAVHDAYAEGVAAGLAKADVIQKMTVVLEQQQGAGTYLSNHMRSNAVDLRSFNLSASDKQKLIAACKSQGATVVLDEGQPPHLHVQF